MSNRQHRPAEFRRYAALCVEFANRMSVRENRDRMMEMAQLFRQLAEEAEEEDVKSE